MRKVAGFRVPAFSGANNGNLHVWKDDAELLVSADDEADDDTNGPKQSGAERPSRPQH